MLSKVQGSHGLRADFNIPIFPRNGKCVPRLDFVFALDGPYILIDILRSENGIITEPNGYCFGEFVIAILAFRFRQAQEIVRTIKFVLASQRERHRGAQGRFPA